MAHPFYVVDAFAKAVIEGTKASPELEEGVDVVLLMEAVPRSVKAGHPV